MNRNILIIVILIIVIGGGVLSWQFWLEQEIITENETEEWILLNEITIEEEDIYSKERRDIHLEIIIDQDTILNFFEKFDGSLTSDWSVHLKRREEEIIIIQDRGMYCYGGFCYRIYRTNDPSVIVIGSALGELTIYSQLRYLDINKKEIIAEVRQIREDPFHTIEVYRGDNKIIKIALDIDSCEGKYSGEKVDWRGFLVNDKAIAIFEEPYVLTCYDPLTYEGLMSNKPYIFVKDVVFNFSFSKLKLKFGASDWANEEEFIYFEKSIVFDLEKGLPEGDYKIE